MTWEGVRAHYPTQWIIFEAHQWEDEGACRHILDMSVVHADCNERTLLETCGTLARQKPESQFYPTFTGWDSPRIGTPTRRTRAGTGYAQHHSALHSEPTPRPTRTPRIV